MLITINYPQSQMNGPPYAVGKDEVISLFKGYNCQQLQFFDDIQNEPKFQTERVDYLEKATYSLYKEKEGGTDFFKGMEAVFKECDNFLTKNSINRIEVKLGDDFNPSIHEAIEVKNSNDFSMSP